jgi:hypothetical protein
MKHSVIMVFDGPGRQEAAADGVGLGLYRVLAS